MLKINSYTLGPLDTNCYLVWDEMVHNLPAVVIDPADAGDFLSDEILHLQLSPQAILLTHGHIDHIMGVSELALNFDIPVLLHKKDVFLVERAVSTAAHWFGIDILPPPPTQDISLETQIKVGAHHFSVLETPGHTPGSVTFYCNSYGKENNYSPIAFVGDVIFENGYGRTDFSYASSKTLFNSIEKIKTAIPAHTRLFPGHGSDFYLY